MLRGFRRVASRVAPSLAAITLCGVLLASAGTSWGAKLHPGPAPPQFNPNFTDGEIEGVRVQWQAAQKALDEKKWDEVRRWIELFTSAAASRRKFAFDNATAARDEREKANKEPEEEGKQIHIRFAEIHERQANGFFIDANGYQQLADKLQEDLDERLALEKMRQDDARRPAPPEKGPVWLPPPWSFGERFRWLFSSTGTFGNRNIAGFAAGTQFNAELGREVPILYSARNLTVAGGAAEIRAPISSVFGSDVPSTFSQMAFYARFEGYSFWGSNSGSVPIGSNNVAFTYLFPNPATDNTGVLAGPSGQEIRIKTLGEALQFRAGLDGTFGIEGLQSVGLIWGIGVIYDYNDMGHEIIQRSLSFPDISARTKLIIDDHFVAPLFRAGVGLDDGNVFGSLVGFAAPGVVFTEAWAKQDNLCGPCTNPENRSFQLRQSFSNAQFSIKAGVELTFGVRITPAISLKAGLNYTHTSHAAFIRPAFTPAEQPARLDFSSSHTLAAGIGAKITF
jgi:hypothetical protein